MSKTLANTSPQTALALKANIDSPILTGTPAAPTPSTGDNTTKISTTAFVTTAINNAIAGVNPAVAVQAATSAILPNSPTYLNGVSGIGATLTAGVTNTALVADGYTPILNDRILVKNQASTFQNGVYFVSQVAALGLAWVITRALDYDMPSDINNSGAIPVINGTVNAVTQWVLTTAVTAVGTDPLTYSQFSANPSTLAPLASPAFTGTPTAPTQSPGNNSTILATTAFVQAATLPSSDLSAFAALGSVIKAKPVGGEYPVLNSSTTLTNQGILLQAVYLSQAQTITGVQWVQNTQGSYTANNYNGVGLYTYSGGTLTLVASSTTDGNIWKVASGTFSTKAFSSTYVAAAGLYYIGALWCESAVTTAPKIVSGGSTVAPNTMDFTNSAKLLCQLTAQTTMASPITISAASVVNGFVWLTLY